MRQRQPTVTRRDLARGLARRNSSLTVETAADFIESFLELLSDELRQLHRIELRRFGVLSPTLRAQRVGWNFAAGKKCLVPPVLRVKFRCGKGLEMEVLKRGLAAS